MLTSDNFQAELICKKMYRAKHVVREKHAHNELQQCSRAAPLCTTHLLAMIIACARLEPPPNPNTQKPISTLETAAQTPQHKTIAPGHTARVKAFNTADHTADTQTTQQACP